MMERFELRVEMPPIAFYDLDVPANGDSSQQVAARIATTNLVQAERYRNNSNLHNNAGLSGALLDAIATPDSAKQRMLTHAAERVLPVSARLSPGVAYGAYSGRSGRL